MALSGIRIFRIFGIECRFIRGNHDAHLEEILRNVGISKALENEDGWAEAFRYGE